MNRMHFLVLSVLIAAPHASAADVIDTSLCDVLKDPASFDGKMVRIKAATVLAGFDEFVAKPQGCESASGALWLAYPEGSKAKAGPVALVQLQMARNGPAVAASPKRAAVTLDKN